MTLGLAGRLAALEAQADPETRYVDFAVQFEAHERVNGKLQPTGATSPIYGGRWDTWQNRYDGLASKVLVLPCSEPQLELVLADIPKLEAGGGRGGGKSEGGVLWCIRHIAERPGELGRVISPSYDLTEVVRTKLLQSIPDHWLLPDGIKLAPKRELHFITGVIVSFRSAVKPDSLRSWGGAWTLQDEDQDITTYAGDVAWFCLRESPDPRLCRTLTPKVGEPFQRHKAYLASPHSKCVRFESKTNPFVDPKTFDIAAEDMAKDTYDIEAGADWDVVARLEEEDGPRYVFRAFSREVHCVNWSHLAEQILMGEVEDLTRKVAAQKRYKGKSYIAGVDPNWDWPNYAVIWKVLSPARPGGKKRWVCVDVVHTKGHCGHLGQEMKRRGYTGRNTLLVPDASARYNQGKRSSANLLRKEGFKDLLLRRKNPPVQASMDAMLAKVEPAKGEPSLFVAHPTEKNQTLPLIEAMEQGIWAKSGKKMDKSEGHDHPIDGGRYAIDPFDPAAKISRRLRRIA